MSMRSKKMKRFSVADSIITLPSPAKAQPSLRKASAQGERSH